MKCVNCEHEQIGGKFCGKCGNTMEVITGSTVETEQAAATENISLHPPQQPTSSMQPNEHIEQVKKTSKLYVSYVKEYIKQPSRIFQVTDQQFLNSIITIAIVLLLTSSTVFLAVKTLYKNTINMADGLVSMLSGGFGNSMLPKVAFFPVFGKAFFFFLLLMAISIAISFIVIKLSKQQLQFKQLVSIYGTLLLPVIGIVLLAFLSILINELVFGLGLLILAFAVAMYVYPLRIVFTHFSGESKIDTTHKGLIYFVGFTFFCYVIVTQYVKGIIDQVGSFINIFDML